MAGIHAHVSCAGPRPPGRRWHPATLVVVPLLPALALVVRNYGYDGSPRLRLGAGDVVAGRLLVPGSGTAVAGSSWRATSTGAVTAMPGAVDDAVLDAIDVVDDPDQTAETRNWAGAEPWPWPVARAGADPSERPVPAPDPATAPAGNRTAGVTGAVTPAATPGPDSARLMLTSATGEPGTWATFPDDAGADAGSQPTMTRPEAGGIVRILVGPVRATTAPTARTVPTAAEAPPG